MMRTMRPCLPGRHAASRHAMTLLEIVMATMMLAMAVVPLLTLLRATTHDTRLTRGRVLAHILASGVIERYRLESVAALAARLPSFDAGAALVSADPALAIPRGPVADLARSTALRRSVAFEPVGSTTRAGALVARVDWTEDGRARRYEIRTLVCDHGASEGSPSDADWDTFSDAFTSKGGA